MCHLQESCFSLVILYLLMLVFFPGIIEMQTISVSTILPLPVILALLSSLVLFHSSLSQLSIFLRSLSQDYTTMSYQKQSLNRRQLWENSWERGYMPVTQGGWQHLARIDSVFSSRKDDINPYLYNSQTWEIFKWPKPRLCHSWTLEWNAK